MSITLLLEKYDVSKEEGLQKALNEIAKEESEVDEALTNVLSRACLLEGQLRTASQAYTKLGEVKSDAQSAADMMDKTAALARDVSAKVRQLDLARSRVAECQHRVHDLIDLQLCSAGVEAAIKAHDYETAATHVSRYLSMDPGSVAAARARGAPDPRAAMSQAADTLRDHLVRKFEEAARKEDEVAVQRLFKLFPQIGCVKEGVTLFAKYNAAQTEQAIRRAGVVGAGGGAVFADTITRVLEAACAAITRARGLHVVCPGHLPDHLLHLQPVVCSGVRRVYRELVARRLAGSAGGAAGGAGGALAAEPLVQELALAHHRHALYFAVLRRHTQADAASLPEERRAVCVATTETLIAGCDLTRTAQEILAHYLRLEKYFLEESVNKALKMAQTQNGDETSGFVDDVFFIARKVINRSVSTGSVDGACATLNEVCSLLEHVVAPALCRRIAASPPPLLPPPPPSLHTQPAAGGGDHAAYAVHATEAECGGEWAERLAAEAVRAALPLCAIERERLKLRECAAGLGAAAAAFRGAAALGLRAARQGNQARVHAWADVLADPHVAAQEDMEADAAALPAALEALSEGVRGQLPARAADDLLAALVTDLAAAVELRMLHHTYTREDGLTVERRVRRVAAWAGSGASGARERCARLTQAAALLAVDSVALVPLALQPASRLAAPDVRALLAARTDFKMEDIKRLKL